jgi:hypothetical protein
MAEIIRHYQPDIDWADLVGLAAKYKLGFVVYAGLWLTEKIMCVAIPPEVFGQLRPHCSKSQLKWLTRVQDKVLIADNSSEIETLIRLRMITELKGKIELLRLIFFPPARELVLYYSFSPDNRLAYLYYLWPNLKSCLSKFMLKI